MTFWCNVTDVEAGHDGETGHLQPPKILTYSKINFLNYPTTVVGRGGNNIVEALLSSK